MKVTHRSQFQATEAQAKGASQLDPLGMRLLAGSLMASPKYFRSDLSRVLISTRRVTSFPSSYLLRTYQSLSIASAEFLTPGGTTQGLGLWHIIALRKLLLDAVASNPTATV